MARGLRAFAGWLLAPLVDAFHGLERTLDSAASRSPRAGVAVLGSILAGLLVGWWLYVPAHELLHAAGCLATGGDVSRLEISPLYLGDLWRLVAPWVVSGGDYAGRLAGFDTHGDDLVYLATVFAPYLLTLFPGVWATRAAARRGSGALYGLSLPLSLAPLVSLAGDAYEIGSIVVTRLPLWSTPRSRELLRGDDLVLVVRGLTGQPDAGALLIAASLAAAIGVLWAVATWWVGGIVATRLGQRGLGPTPRSESPSAAAVVDVPTSP